MTPGGQFNAGECHPSHKLTEEDVKNIRLRKKNGEQLSSVYNDYSDKLTYKSFENVWSYRNWKKIIV